MTTDVLYDSTGEPIAGTVSNLDTQKIGFSFTTGATSSFFSDVSLLLAATNPNDGGSVTVLLGSGPVQSLANPALETIGVIQDSGLGTTASLTTLTGPSGLVLAPDTTYWIELESTAALNESGAAKSSAALAFEAGAVGTGVANGENNVLDTVFPNSEDGAYIAKVDANVVAPTVAFDTTSQTVAPGPLNLNGIRAGFSFATGAQAGYLSSVSLGLQASNPGDGGNVTVALYSSSNGGPGTLLATLGTVADASLGNSETLVTLQVTGSIALVPGTQYWVELTGNSSSAGLNFETGVGGIGTSGQSIAPSGGAIIPDTDDGAPIASVQELACYCAGTMIATDCGEIAVEELQIGDLVLTTDGLAKPVAWIGRRTVAAQFADPICCWPVRVKAGALDKNIPARDLLLSPDHALLVGGLLIQAGALVNGTSIIRETAVPASFVYYHVELDDHSLIFAENAPAETFIDNVDRMGFDNWSEHEALYPQGKTAPELPYPRAKARRQVPVSIRAALERRAEAAGAIATSAA